MAYREDLLNEQITILLPNRALNKCVVFFIQLSKHGVQVEPRTVLEACWAKHLGFSVNTYYLESLPHSGFAEPSITI